MDAPSGAGAWPSKTSRVLPRPWTAEGDSEWGNWIWWMGRSGSDGAWWQGSGCGMVVTTALGMENVIVP